jgi:deoxyribonuclease V
VAKTRLVGVHGRVPAGKGLWTSLLDQHEVIGAVLRPRAGVKPLVVSIGHRISLETAVRWVMTCVTHHRLPETTRWAHRLASGDVRSGARVPGRARRREQTWATVSRPSRTRRRGAGRGRTPPARR